MCPDYYTKQSNGEVPQMPQLWGMQSTSLWPSIPGLPWPAMVVFNRVLSMGQKELNCVLILNWNSVLFGCIWNRTVFKFNCVQTKMHLY